MISVENFSNEFLKVSFKYYEDYINRIKQVPGAKFNKETKSWLIPKQCLELLEITFDDELYYKTPRWKIIGDPKPNYIIDLKNNYDIPELSNGLKPFKYQEFSFNYMMNKLDEEGFVINCCGVGLGKTPMAILCFKSLYEQFKASKLIILAKKSIKKQWVDEIKKFTDLEHKLDSIEYIGENATKKQRDKIYKNFSKLKSGVLVTTYQSCLNDKDMISEAGFDIAVIDEAHILRTVNGKINLSVKTAISNTKYKILLTGTPIMARPRDLYALVNLCNEEYLGKYKAFTDRYVVTANRGTYIEDVGIKNISKLRNIIQNILIRLTEHEVDIELPTIIESKIEIEMDKTQKKLMEIISLKQDEYSSEIEKLTREIKKYEINNYDPSKLLGRLNGIEGMNKGLISCRQAVANDPLLLLLSKSKMISEMFAEEIPKDYKCSPKTEWLINKVEEIIESGSKVIIFSKFERSSRLLQDKIENSLHKKCLLFTGDINEETRNKNIDLFNNDDEYCILIGSDAMSEGINLQKSNHVIHYDQPETLAIKVQRIGRIRRASSKHKTGYSYDLITEGSVDEKVLEKLNNQGNLVGSLIDLNEEESSSFKKVSN